MTAVASLPVQDRNGAESVRVPWTRRQEEAIKALAGRSDEAPWRLGELALEAVPMGDLPGRATGGQKFIRLLAARTDVEFNTLETARRVAYSWPAHTRVLAGTWGAHRAWTEGGPDNAPERAKLLVRLARDAAHGKVTADAVRKERAKEMGANYHAKPPGERLLDLCDKARHFLGPLRTEVGRHLLDVNLGQGWRKRNLGRVRSRADQLRYAADLLDLIADDQDLPPKEEISERLDPKAW